VRFAGASVLPGMVALATACAPALREPPPLEMLGRAGSSAAAAAPIGASVDELLAQAAASFDRRPDVAEVERARQLFFAAARSEEGGVEGLLGAARALAWLIEHESEGRRREALATEAVQACQWCRRLAPAKVECRYRLALALGQQARERPSTGVDALPQIVSLLEQVIAADPLLDAAGGHRVLALVLLRAPGWPAGPGDPEAGLEHAREADVLVPAHPANLLVLGEALEKNGRPAQASQTFARAEAQAEVREAAGDPDAREWIESAVRARAALCH
jgi:hypothetical protein